MSDLFTKAEKVKTATKLWVIGIALIIMLNMPYGDDHTQPAPVMTPALHPLSAEPQSVATISPPSNTHPPLPSSVTGEYVGSVSNETAALSANFAVTLRESKGKLSGSMSVEPPLYGSGPLEGTVSGLHMAFAVSSSIGSIEFVGTRSRQGIVGTYTVIQKTGGTEKGSFTLKRSAMKVPK
ncbi:hypothetical protein [Terriglobus roseus]|uniref:Uncharacterized protein n=1 Tax=Terriglobus roseus TaxID=392734 RepID=A0A1G7QQB0_9BACT|nr:hypothetical protein [Terriglobus roseus]SDG00698.1 hypothetical protein SAMN05444167_3958 [Terriglobus roseus]